jgi:hypothetical protein
VVAVVVLGILVEVVELEDIELLLKLFQEKQQLQ